MPSKKKKLTPLQKEYNKQYKAYLKRIERAREAGFIIPENYVKIKKEKPRTRDIEALKKVTRKSIEKETTKGKLEFVSPFTGEIITGGRASDISRQRRQKPIKYERPNLERPTSFDEAQQVIERIRYYFDRYEVPESAKEWQMERIMEQTLRTLRGPDFDFEKFKKQEKENGWLFRDPNRPLDPEEVEHIQSIYDKQHSETTEGQLFRPKKVLPELIEDLRGWNTAFNYYDEFLDEELAQKDNVFNKVNEYVEDQFKDYSRRDHDGPWERPKTEKRTSSDTSEEPIEYMNINNLLERLRAINIEGKYYAGPHRHEMVSKAQHNRAMLDNFLYNNMKYGNGEALDKALAEQNATGRAFQVWFLYKGTVMAEYLSDLEHLMFSRDNYYENAERVENVFEGEDDYA